MHHICSKIHKPDIVIQVIVKIDIKNAVSAVKYFHYPPWLPAVVALAKEKKE